MLTCPQSPIFAQQEYESTTDRSYSTLRVNIVPFSPIVCGPNQVQREEPSNMDESTSPFTTPVKHADRRELSRRRSSSYKLDYYSPMSVEDRRLSFTDLDHPAATSPSIEKRRASIAKMRGLDQIEQQTPRKPVVRCSDGLGVRPPVFSDL